MEGTQGQNNCEGGGGGVGLTLIDGPLSIVLVPVQWSSHLACKCTTVVLVILDKLERIK